MTAQSSSNAGYNECGRAANVHEGQTTTAIVDTSAEIVMLHNMGLLDKLLADKTTGGNITWATDQHEQHGHKYAADQQIRPELILGLFGEVIQVRTAKSREQQVERTRQKGEVFTPIWVVDKMNQSTLEDARESAAAWNEFVDFRMLEITCGEGPFLVTRYDTESGERIPLHGRVGLLDAKLRDVTQHTQDEREWTKWAIRAYESTYGYEYYGDSLLIARVNLIMTFLEYYESQWKRRPDYTLLRQVTNVVAWNIWQMDGLTGRTPATTVLAPLKQLSLFDDEEDSQLEYEAMECRIFDWRARRSLSWLEVGR